MSERVVLIKQGSLQVEQDINTQDVFITTHYRSTDRDILNILSDIRKKEVDYIDPELLKLLEEEKKHENI